MWLQSSWSARKPSFNTFLRHSANVALNIKSWATLPSFLAVSFILRIIVFSFRVRLQVQDTLPPSWYTGYTLQGREVRRKVYVHPPVFHPSGRRDQTTSIQPRRRNTISIL